MRALRVCSARDLINFVRSNAAAQGIAIPTNTKNPAELYRFYCKTRGETNANGAMLERVFLISIGAAQRPTLSQVWESITSLNGYISGNLNDRIRAFIKNFSESGG